MVNLYLTNAWKYRIPRSEFVMFSSMEQQRISDTKIFHKIVKISFYSMTSQLSMERQCVKFELHFNLLASDLADHLLNNKISNEINLKNSEITISTRTHIEQPD